jgi:hypothetical protein
MPYQIRLERACMHAALQAMSSHDMGLFADFCALQTTTMMMMVVVVVMVGEEDLGPCRERVESLSLEEGVIRIYCVW